MKAAWATMLLLAIAGGCAAPRTSHSGVLSNEAQVIHNESAPVQHAKFEIKEPNTEVKTPFAGLSELTSDALVGEVLARNPTIAAMTAAWRAAAARHGQVTSLDDPMFGAYVAPGAFGSNTVDGGYRVELSQKFLYPGKLALKGQSALAEASAAANEVEEARVQLAESARSAFFDYYAAARA